MKLSRSLLILVCCIFVSAALHAKLPCSEKYRIPGDYNEDCILDLIDLSVFAEAWLAEFNRDNMHSFIPIWQAEPPMMTARDQFTGGVINGKIYVFGGNGNPNGQNLASMEMYDPTTRQWCERNSTTCNEEGVEELTSAVVDGKLYVFGAWGWTGTNSGMVNFNKVYDPIVDDWMILAPKPTCVSSAAATVFNGEIYLWGGVSEDPNGNQLEYYGVEVYNPTNDSWRIATNIPRHVTKIAVTTIGDKAYLIGGYLPDEDIMSPHVMSYDYVTEKWQIEGYAPMRGDRARAFTYSSSTPEVDGKVYLIGGRLGPKENIYPARMVDIYDTKTNTWKIGPALPLPLDNHVSVILGDRIIVLGGVNVYESIYRCKAEVMSLDIFPSLDLLEMAMIPGGTYQMGDILNEEETDSRPVHAVTLSSFLMGKYEVTNGQYCDFLNFALSQDWITLFSVNGLVYKAQSEYYYCHISTDDSYSQISYSNGIFSVCFKNGRSMVDDPVIEVTRVGAAAYCNWRSLQEGLEPCYDLSTWVCDFSKNGYRLPTEAEWEYAARGGLSGKRFSWGNTISHHQANYYSIEAYYYDISSTRNYHPIWNDGLYPYTSPVGSFSSNGYGLYDMTGNVEEWCNDWYSNTYYASSPLINPTGPVTGSHPVCRGGSWGYATDRCRVAFRSDASDWLMYVGFRVVRNY